jgi:inorganic pyrophosphatase
MNLWHDIETGPKAPHVVNVVVEIPRGAQNKYEFDRKLNIIRLDRVLFSPLHYPGDYGIIPRTLAPDGDPLDAMVLVTYPNFPGVLIEAKPIGIFRMVDSNTDDSKILCVPVDDVRLSHYRDIRDLPQHILKEISHFFEVYKELEDKKVRILGWEGAVKAKKAITEAAKKYRNAYADRRRG